MFVSIALCGQYHPQPKPQPVQFQKGQTYVYQYKGRLLSGIPGLADQYSGFEIVSDLVLQPINDETIAMQVNSIDYFEISLKNIYKKYKFIITISIFNYFLAFKH